jgi:hypothetical protein
MKNVVIALVEAFWSLTQPKMLALVLWPVLASAVLWTVTAVIFWGRWAAALTRLLQSETLAKRIGDGASGAISHSLVILILIALLFLAAYLTTLLITAIFTMPAIVNHVAEKEYFDLERMKGGNLLGSLSNTAIAIALYAIGWVLTLPTWLFPPLAIVLSVILTAYLTQRLFRYDALAEHASQDEIGEIIEGSSRKLYLLGGIAGLLQLVPVINLLSPVYVGLAFTHFCLAELRDLRET